ncbi:MAG: hypothetical protein HGA78_03890 [Nitrospirales bacterium]|nr:hypothetical protein [Nitrospirales bacterium]
MNGNFSGNLVSRFLALSEGIAVTVVAIGVLILAGWFFDIPALKSVFPEVFIPEARRVPK